MYIWCIYIYKHIFQRVKIGTQNGTLVNGTQNENLGSNLWWYHFNPYPYTNDKYQRYQHLTHVEGQCGQQIQLDQPRALKLAKGRQGNPEEKWRWVAQIPSPEILLNLCKVRRLYISQEQLLSGAPKSNRVLLGVLWSW